MRAGDADRAGARARHRRRARRGGEAVESMRAAGAAASQTCGVPATRARPVARREARRPEGGAGLHGGGAGRGGRGGVAGTGAEERRGGGGGGGADAARGAAAAAAPPALTPSAPCSRRCAARPLGSPRSRARCAGASSVSAATEAATRAGRLAWRVAGRAPRRSVVGKRISGKGKRRRDGRRVRRDAEPTPRRRRRRHGLLGVASFAAQSDARGCRVRTRVAARDPVTARAHALRERRGAARSQTRRVFS